MTSPTAAVTTSRGRVYKVPHPETRELLDLAGVSSLKKQMYSYPLEAWKLRKVAAAVAASPALQAQASDPDEVRHAVKSALDKDTEASDLGTAVHKLIETEEAGAVDDEFVAPVLRPFLDAYRECKARFGFEVIGSEASIYNITDGYAGTADQWVKFPWFAQWLEAEHGIPYTGDLFAADIKTGKGVYAETALQLRFYAGGEGIVSAPSKHALGFTQREAQLEDDIRAGVGFDRINPARRTWSTEAIREAKAALEDEWWQAYAEGCTFHPMPAGLRRDFGVVIHLHHHNGVHECRLVPLRLDGDEMSDGSSRSVIIGLVDQAKWTARRDIVLPTLTAEASLGEPEPLVTEPLVTEPLVTEPTAMAIAETLAAATSDRGEPCATVDEVPDATPTAEPTIYDKMLARRAAAEAEDEAIAASTPDCVVGNEGRTVGDCDECPGDRACPMAKVVSTFPGSVVLDQDDAPAPQVSVDMRIEWLKDIQRSRPEKLGPLRAALDAAGITKSLLRDSWTIGELRQWVQVAAQVERP